MVEIRQVFIDHLKERLGFSDDQINEAWEKAQTTIYTDYFTLEIMTRDLLQRPTETEESMKPYLRKE